ncbi:excalibur calcium-binding domain-containing protein [Hyphomicrobium sp. MC1]|uniref:excalibur calcium-binding domain-containing protein n=1 Tax=Hyphomicrobium sp. (strain MC1) TaxID=717785 RepID=UPI0035277BD0
MDQKAGAATSSQPCGTKRTCREMSSCEEARHYLRDCGLRRLDGDGDGVPCNSLCRGR